MEAPVAFADKEIDGIRYSLYAMSPDKVIEHGNALLGTVFSNIAGRAMGGDETAFLSAIVANLSSPVVKAAIADLWETALANGNPLGKNAWKAHFLGKSGTMVRFIVWAMEAQFTDFFGSLIGVLKDAQVAMKAKAAQKAQSSPTTS